MSVHTPLQISASGAIWHIAGELDRQGAAELYRWCEALPVQEGVLELELLELEICDGEGAAVAIDAIRLLLQRTTRLILWHAPHTLAHTLYRIGMLESGSRLILTAPREEEPYG